MSRAVAVFEYGGHAMGDLPGIPAIRGTVLANPA
jgi:hypothetical protein